MLHWHISCSKWLSYESEEERNPNGSNIDDAMESILHLLGDDFGQKL
jgi:hypothetical protein